MDNSTPGMNEKMVQYLDGELTGIEKDRFEQELAADESLQIHFDNLKATREAIKLYGLRQTVGSIHGSMMHELGEETPPVKIGTQQRTRRKMIVYSLGVAASLLLLIGGYIAWDAATLSADRVFSSRYRPYELVTLREGDSKETALTNAYREKNYPEVLRIYETGEDNSTTAIFLSGVAALALKDNVKAIQSFKKLIDSGKQSPEPALVDGAEYYLALTYIRNKAYDAALALLFKIRETANHVYNEEVTPKLVRQVKRLSKR